MQQQENQVNHKVKDTLAAQLCKLHQQFLQQQRNNSCSKQELKSS